MKIAIFSDNFYPELSGISDSIILLAGELVKLGHEIRFYVPRYGPQNYQAINLPVQELKLGDKIKIKRLFSLPAPFAGQQARLVLPLLSGGLFKKFKPEIIHSQLFFGAGLEGMVRARLGKVPLVGTNHTAISEFVKFAPFNLKLLKKISLNYSVWYYNHCDFVTAPSRSVFNEMSQYGFNRPHQVISNPIDTKIFSLAPNKSELKKQFALTDKTIVYAGRLASEKNIEVVIRAVALIKKRISNVNLAIAGSGKFKPELKQLVKELNLEKEVKFFGILDKIKLTRLYNASDIFAIASTSESQSMVTLQAMACGLPVIGVNWRALPEYINRHNGYTVEAGNPKAIADKIIHLFRHEAERILLGQGGLKYVQQFSSEKIAEKWEEIYERVIKL
jgi:glycosyltransferase involved in cell wall biosynthesis